MPRHVNMHSHIIPRETKNQVPPHGPVLTEEADGSVSYQVGKCKIYAMPGDAYMLDPRMNDSKARLVDMDAKGVDVMGVSIAPWPLANPYFDCLVHEAKGRRFLVEFVGARSCPGRGQLSGPGCGGRFPNGQGTATFSDR
jgi:hypothetical protein